MVCGFDHTDFVQWEGRHSLFSCIIIGLLILELGYIGGVMCSKLPFTPCISNLTNLLFCSLSRYVTSLKTHLQISGYNNCKKNKTCSRHHQLMGCLLAVLYCTVWSVFVSELVFFEQFVQKDHSTNVNAASKAFILKCRLYCGSGSSVLFVRTLLWRSCTCRSKVICITLLLFL